jgi:DNA-binding IclR family transcriptional regulator
MDLAETKLKPELQTVGRALRLLAHFAERPATGWTLTELAHVLGLSKSTVARLLATLVAGEFLERRDDNRYHLGAVAIALGGAALGAIEIRSAALPAMRRLTEVTGETSLLHVARNDASCCVEKIESRLPVRVSYEIGSRGPLYAGSSGKGLLAFLPESEIERILERVELHGFTQQTITSRADLQRELHETRARGYAESAGELDDGVSAVGVPLFDADGNVVAGLTLVCPTVRWTGAHRKRCIGATLDAAKSVHQRLGVDLEDRRLA